MRYEDKLCLKKALLRYDGTYDRKGLLVVLKKAEEFGLEWGTRTMYGGGSEIQLSDKFDIVANMTVYNKEIHVNLEKDYFEKDFKYSEIRYYSDEQLAEIKNEEVLYGYELPHYYIVKGKDL